MRFKWKENKGDCNKKGFLKISSSLLLCIFILGLIVIPKSEPVSADEIKPKIDVTYLGSNPQEPMAGQDIEVRYQVTPQPFQYKIVKEKEIVLVLDGSESMKYNDKMKNLKAAANAFIDKLRNVENLKVGIVVYDFEAETNPNRNISKNEYLLDVKDDRLKAIIRDTRPYGQTNTGDGLRMGEFLLQQGNSNADKTLILMSDGLPNRYLQNRYTGRYYDEINNFGPKNNREIVSSLDRNTGEIALKYATMIGNIIKEEKHNIFSIGYGLGVANSNENMNMQKIHTSMGGVVNKDPSNINNTFFASDEGAIESIFGKIADKLLKSYSINDVKINGYLGSGLTAVDGFEVNGNNKDVISVPPIVYELTKINGEDWYTAKPIIITFKIKANEAGKYHIFDSKSRLEYTAVDGGKISVPIADTSIEIKKFAIEDSKKLQVDFYPEKSGYLMGDSANVIAGFTKPKGDEFNFNNAKFDITNGIPTAIELKEGNPGLDFGTINEGSTTKQYSFNIKDNITETTNEITNHTINGRYSYAVEQRGSKADISGSKDATINIKRGNVLVEVVDTKGEKINSGIKVSLQDTSTNSTFSTKESEAIDNGVVKFNTIPTGNYKATLTNIPAGYEFTNGNEAIVSVNYENNIAKYKFVLNGENNDKPNINVTLKSGENISTTLGESVDVTYGITAESFEYKKYSNEAMKEYIVKDAVLNFDLGENLDPVSGFVSNDRKTVQVRIPEIKYILNISKNIYEPKLINDITIGVRSNKIGDIEFGTANNISYKNLLGGNIIKKVDVPKIKVIDGVYEIKHGLYEGIKDNQISISEANVTIAGGTNVNFGAEFTTKSTAPTINLGIDENYEDIKKIKVYKLIEGKLEDVDMQIIQGSIIDKKKSYKIVLPKEISTGTKILIRYSAKLPNSRKVVYINNIKVGSSIKNATVTTTDTVEEDRLPDLF